MPKHLIYSPQTIVLQPNVYGNGSDGDIVYTVSQTVNTILQARNITINPGVILTLGHGLIFCQNRITNNGTIKYSGTDASGITAGTTAGGAFYGLRISAAAGRNSAGIGNSTITTALSWGAAGDQNSFGGAAGGNAGGSAATDSADPNGYNEIFDFYTALRGQTTSFFANAVLPSGSGGGGGAFGAGATGTSGAGGGGGGICCLVCKTYNGANGVFDLRGGAGSAGAGTGNLGGGGGGSGGLALILCQVGSTGSNLLTGGAGGAGLGTGSAGAAGTTGAVKIMQSV